MLDGQLPKVSKMTDEELDRWYARCEDLATSDRPEWIRLRTMIEQEYLDRDPEYQEIVAEDNYHHLYGDY